MSHRPWPLRAADILGAIAEIQSFVRGTTFEQFAADAKTIRAVSACFAIVGEASSHLPPEVTAQAPEIAWKQIRRMRNIMVHAYFGVDLPIVWQTIEGDLPPLQAALRRVLAASGRTDVEGTDT